MLGRLRPGKGRRALLAACVTVGVWAVPAEAQAFDLTISTTDPTSNVATTTGGSTTTFTGNGEPAVLNVAQLDPALDTGDAVVDAGGVSGTISVAADISSVAAGGGSLTLDPAAGGDPIAINTASISTNGGQTYNGPVTLGTTAGLTSTGSGNIAFVSTVDGAHGLTTSTAGATTFNGEVGSNAPLAGLATGTGTTNLDTDLVKTTADQTYNGPVTLGTTAGLTSTDSGNIAFVSTVDGGQDLNVDTGGTTTFNGTGSGALTSLTTDAGGTTALNGAMTTTAAQTYNDPVSLGSLSTLSGSSATFNSTVDGPGGLDTTGVTTTNFDGVVGGTTPVPSLTTGPGTAAISAAMTLGGGTIGGALTGAGAVTKVGGGPLALTGNNTYSGGTTVTGGLISFSTPSNFGPGPGPGNTGTITLNGGGLQWASNTSDISSRLNPIGSNGATFDTNGNNVTFAQPLSGSGSVTKARAGMLTLQATNTYTGATVVNGGTLHLTGSLIGQARVQPDGAFNCDGGTLSGGLTNNGGSLLGAPSAPINPSAVAGNGHATVSFTPSAAPRCFPVSYAAIASPGGVHGSGAGSPIAVTPLQDGTTYTFTVKAINPIGTSAPSGRSNAVKPLGPPPIARILFPGNGQKFKFGAFVPTSISCVDGTDGPGIADCADSSSLVLKTSRPGTFRYSVTAFSEDGQATTSSILYTVLLPPNNFNKPKLRKSEDGTVTFALKLPGPGTVDVLEAAAKNDVVTAVALRPAKGQFTFASSHVRIKKAGNVSFRIKPNAAGRRMMRHHRHAVATVLSIRYTPRLGKPRTVVLRGIRLTR